MAPRQRTFTIVPTPLGMQGLVQRPAGEAPKPMTSKQAQKLHRQATRLPKRTKAEQIQYEREQQRLIKEEDEKRRASNKARMLRERKKEKEQTLIQAKKRKGLPLVDVRPSQDLITRFVRGNGSGMKRDASGAPVQLDSVREESPACDSATETAADEDADLPSDEEAETSDKSVEAPEPRPEPSPNPAKRLRTALSPVGTLYPRPDQSPRRSPRASRTAVSALRMLDARSRESSLDVDDPVVEELLRTQIIEETISAANSSAIQQLSPAPKIPSGKENIPPASQGFVKKTSPKLAQAQPRIQCRSPTGAKFMPPPPPPSSCLKRRASLQTPVHRPSLPQNNHRLAQDLGLAATESVLPSSTQMFLLSNLDDILPSPSQELRELEDATPSRPATSGPQPPLWKPMPSFTSHELQTLRRPTSRHQPTVPPPRWAPRPIQPASGAPSKMQGQMTAEPALPVFSTQDLLLSSQDIRDVQETTETPSRPAKLPAQPLKSPSRTRQTGQAVSEVATQRAPLAKESEDRSQSPHAPPSGLRKSQPRTPLCSSPKASQSSELPKPSPSPRQRRFFTASNEAVQLAMEKSMRTHKEEERRREAEQRALQLLRREEQEDVGDEEEHEEAEEHEDAEENEDLAEAIRVAHEQQYDYLLDELADDVEAEMQELLRFEERDAEEDDQADMFDLDDDIAEELLAAEYDSVRGSSPPLLPMGHGSSRPAEELRVCAASQETDYGDLDVSFEDLDEYF